MEEVCDSSEAIKRVEDQSRSLSAQISSLDIEGARKDSFAPQSKQTINYPQENSRSEVENCGLYYQVSVELNKNEDTSPL